MIASRLSLAGVVVFLNVAGDKESFFYATRSCRVLEKVPRRVPRARAKACRKAPDSRHFGTHDAAPGRHTERRFWQEGLLLSWPVRMPLKLLPQQQERAFGLLRKVYPKRAKIRGEQPLSAMANIIPGRERRYCVTLSAKKNSLAKPTESPRGLSVQTLAITKLLDCTNPRMNSSPPAA